MTLRQPYAAFVRTFEVLTTGSPEPDSTLQYRCEKLHAEFSTTLGYFLAYHHPNGRITTFDPKIPLQLFAFGDCEGIFHPFGHYYAGELADNYRIEDFKKVYEKERQLGASVKEAAEFAEKSVLLPLQRV